MLTSNVYLNFNGNCFEAFTFYQSVLGGEFSYVGRFKDFPAVEGQPPLSEAMADKIMHMGLPISKETQLMGSDIPEGFVPHFVQGNNCAIMLSAGSKEEADRLFEGLSAGGQILTPIGFAFWGDYFGMFTDKFGVHWMVIFDPNAKP